MGWDPTPEEVEILVSSFEAGELHKTVAAALGKTVRQVGWWYERRGMLRRPRWGKGELEKVTGKTPAEASEVLGRSAPAIAVRRSIRRKDGDPASSWHHYHAKMRFWTEEVFAKIDGLSDDEAATALGVTIGALRIARKRRVQRQQRQK